MRDAVRDAAPPPGLRPVTVAVVVAAVVGVSVAALTALHASALLDLQQAADPSASRSSLSSTLWSRVGGAGAAALVWPALLRRLRRGRVATYARMRLASAILAVVLTSVALTGTEPTWLRALQLLQSAAQLGILAALLRPALRAWFDAHRPEDQPPGAWRPALFLLLAAPFVAEVSIGDLPFSGEGLLAAAVVLPIYSGTLLIRELVRRAGRGWGSILALGAAFMLVEEGLALQSLFSPTIYDGAGPAWGARWWGVNGVYGLVQLVNHVVWSVAVPIALAEVAFPAHRSRPWLRRPVLVLTVLLYVAGVGLVLLTARTTLTPGYRASTPALAATGAVTIALVVGAFVVRPRPPGPVTGRSKRPGPTRITPPAAWSAVGAIAGFVVLAGLVWPGHFGAAYPRTPLVLAPIVLAVAVVAATGWSIARAHRQGGWTDRHTIGLCGGLITGHVVCWGVTQPHGTVPHLAVLVLLVLTLLWLGRLHLRLTHPPRGRTPRSPRTAGRLAPP